MKTFFIVSSLGSARSYEALADRMQHESEADAIEHAKTIIEKRRRQGNSDMSFYILKAVAVVGKAVPPIEVTRLEEP